MVSNEVEPQRFLAGGLYALQSGGYGCFRVDTTASGLAQPRC